MLLGRHWLAMVFEGELLANMDRWIDGLTALVKRMYRGMLPPLIGVTPIFAISFWVSYFARRADAEVID